MGNWGGNMGGGGWGKQKGSDEYGETKGGGGGKWDGNLGGNQLFRSLNDVKAVGGLSADGRPCPEMFSNVHPNSAEYFDAGGLGRDRYFIAGAWASIPKCRASQTRSSAQPCFPAVLRLVSTLKRATCSAFPSMVGVPLLGLKCRGTVCLIAGSSLLMIGRNPG